MEIVCDGIIYAMQPHGGITRFYNEVLPRLCELDENLSVQLLLFDILKGRPPAHKRISQLSIPQWVKHLPGKRTREKMWPLVRRVLTDANPRLRRKSVWHSTYYQLPPKNWRGPSVAFVHDMIYERFSNLFNSLEDDQVRDQKRQCVRNASYIVCNSETTRDDVCRFFNLENQQVHTLPLACSPIFHQPNGDEAHFRLQMGKPYFLYVGRRVHYKNFNRLIDAYSQWTKRGEVALIVVGSPWSKIEEEQLHALGISHHVRLIEHADDSLLSQLYQGAQALVYPSLYEGFGIPLLEAMSSGCPVIASDIPSTREVAVNCPIFFEPASTEALVAAFDFAIAEGRNSPRVALGQQIASRYSWEKTAKEFLTVFQRAHRQ